MSATSLTPPPGDASDKESDLSSPPASPTSKIPRSIPLATSNHSSPPPSHCPSTPEPSSIQDALLNGARTRRRSARHQQSAIAPAPLHTPSRSSSPGSSPASPDPTSTTIDHLPPNLPRLPSSEVGLGPIPIPDRVDIGDGGNAGSAASSPLSESFPETTGIEGKGKGREVDSPSFSNRRTLVETSSGEMGMDVDMESTKAEGNKPPSPVNGTDKTEDPFPSSAKDPNPISKPIPTDMTQQAQPLDPQASTSNLTKDEEDTHADAASQADSDLTELEEDDRQDDDMGINKDSPDGDDGDSAAATAGGQTASSSTPNSSSKAGTQVAEVSPSKAMVVATRYVWTRGKKRKVAVMDETTPDGEGGPKASGSGSGEAGSSDSGMDVDGHDGESGNSDEGFEPSGSRRSQKRIKVSPKKEPKRKEVANDEGAADSAATFTWWTAEEQKILFDLVYPRVENPVWKDIAQALPGRTPESCRTQGLRLKQAVLETFKKYSKKDSGN